ncbi:hypothetical protein, partial [Candidatus Neomicrothrix sp.]|uniref:hypothetical protein n=1 Tax=Candidatus Neomicrothrix sp. TaxID=2719034 RepID=UPI002C2244C7
MLVLVGLLIWRPGPLGWVAMAVQMVMLLTTLTVAEVRIPGLGDKVPSDGMVLGRLLAPTSDAQ